MVKDTHGFPACRLGYPRPQIIGGSFVVCKTEVGANLSALLLSFSLIPVRPPTPAKRTVEATLFHPGN